MIPREPTTSRGLKGLIRTAGGTLRRSGLHERPELASQGSSLLPGAISSYFTAVTEMDKMKRSQL